MNDERAYQVIGANLRRYRTARRMTQEEFVSGLSMDANYLSNIERGRHNISVEKFCEICAVHGIDPKVLLPKLPVEEEDTEPLLAEIQRRIAAYTPRQLQALLRFLDIADEIG